MAGRLVGDDSGHGPSARGKSEPACAIHRCQRLAKPPLDRTLGRIVQIAREDADRGRSTQEGQPEILERSELHGDAKSHRSHLGEAAVSPQRGKLVWSWIVWPYTPAGAIPSHG